MSVIKAVAHSRRGARLPVLRCALLLALAWALLGGASAAHANRFGPPWQSEVTAERTISYSQPDRNSAPVGPLPKGAIVVVLGEANAEFAQTHLGYIPTADIAERDAPWVAEVVVSSASVYAKPDAKSAIRQTVEQGHLMRVTGVSPGLQGDPHIWWSTTEGYLMLGDLTQAQGEWAQNWTLPDPNLATQGWWGTISSAANVRAGATTDSPIVGEFGGGEQVKVLAEEQGEDVQGSSTWYLVDGGRYAGARVHSSLISRIQAPQPNTTVPSTGGSGRWIVVDRAAKTLTLVNNGQPVFSTYVALGVAGRQTPAGTYSTFLKFRADDMTSTSIEVPDDYYDLPNVPDTQYYLDGGYAIHGTYWHDKFGSSESHGCINLTWTDGAYLFEQTLPEVPPNQVRSSSGQGATPVLVIN